MIASMTAFAAGQGGQDGHRWTWDIRSVNGKGLDLRLRLPDGIEGLEVALRARLGQALARGTVSVTLRVQTGAGPGRATLDPGFLETALEALARIEDRAVARGVTLAPATAADLLGLRGMLDGPVTDAGTTALCAPLMADFEAVLDGFLAMRATEGRALEQVLSAQIGRIAQLTRDATRAAADRQDAAADTLRAALARVLRNADAVDETRLAQELAMIAVKQDVTEELDRLRAHADAARGLLAQDAPVGRRLDFLAQEFNREANTLCSKAQNATLSALGLDLKTVIDQMREQVQNVE